MKEPASCELNNVSVSSNIAQYLGLSKTLILKVSAFIAMQGSTGSGSTFGLLGLSSQEMIDKNAIIEKKYFLIFSDW